MPVEVADAGSGGRRVKVDMRPRGQAAAEDNTPRLNRSTRKPVAKDLETWSVLPGYHRRLRADLLSVTFKNSSSGQQLPNAHIVTEDRRDGSLDISYLPVEDTTLELMYAGLPVQGTPCALGCPSAPAEPSTAWVSVSAQVISAGETIWACVHLWTAEGRPASSRSQPDALVATLCRSSSESPTRAASRPPVISGKPTSMAQGVSMFEFKVKEPGAYNLLVENCGVSLPGCPVPITVNLRCTKQARAAAPTSPQFKLPNQLQAVRQASIHIDCPACGPGSSELPAVLVTKFRPAAHAVEHASVEESMQATVEVLQAGKCRALWNPIRAGFFRVDVTFPGQAAASSAFVRVVPAAVDPCNSEVMKHFARTLHAGEAACMDVALRDQFGNRCMDPPASLQLHTGPPGSTRKVELQACAVPMHAKNVCRIWASMTRAGSTEVSATVAGRKICSAPVKCTVLPRPPDSVATHLAGPGIGSVAVGGTSTVTLAMRGAFGNAAHAADVPEDVQHWQASPQHEGNRGGSRRPLAEQRVDKIGYAPTTAPAADRTFQPSAPKQRAQQQCVTAQQQPHQGGTTPTRAGEVELHTVPPEQRAAIGTPAPPRPERLDFEVQQHMLREPGAEHPFARSVSLPMRQDRGRNAAGRPPSGLKRPIGAKQPDGLIGAMLRGLVGMKALTSVPVSIAPLQSGAHHSCIEKLFKDQVRRSLRKQGIQPDWCSPAETRDGRRPFTVALFTPEDKRMDSDDVAIALRRSGHGAPDMLCFVMDQDARGTAGLQESHQLTDPEAYANIAALLQPRGRPNGPLPSRQLADFFVRGSKALEDYNDLCYEAVYKNAKHVHLSRASVPGGDAPGRGRHGQLTNGAAAAQDVHCMRAASHPGPMSAVTSEPAAAAFAAGSVQPPARS